MIKVVEVDLKQEDNVDLWERITFKTTSYNKNFDFVVKNEQFVTEYNGDVSEIRFNERKPPFTVGEYAISVWNFKLAKKFDVNLIKTLKEFKIEDGYRELNQLIDDYVIDLNQINKLIIIHTFILHPKYRKRGITEEFIEFLYRNFYHDKNNKMIALVKPVQTNKVDYDFYQNQKTMKINQLIGKDSPFELVPAYKYYDLPSLIKNEDVEINEYKLFSVAVRCGFNRIGESHLFDFKPNKMIERINNKRK